MSTPSDITIKQRAFFTRLASLDDYNHEFLASQRLKTLNDCFTTVFTHNSFSLPCFRLRAKDGLTVPIEIRQQTQAWGRIRMLISKSNWPENLLSLIGVWHLTNVFFNIKITIEVEGA
jgi:hypothetical protein